MRKYNIVCPIRKANPYRRMAKATKEHRVVPNLLNRNFKAELLLLTLPDRTLVKFIVRKFISYCLTERFRASNMQ